MKKKLAKLIDLKSIVTLLMNVAMIIMLFWCKEIDREILMIFSTAYGSVMAYYFSRKEKE
jgi:hypothetical protein